MRKLRFRCHLLGCKPDPDGFCRRCGVFPWDYTGNEQRQFRFGWAPALRLWSYRVRRRLSWPRCAHCRRRLWPIVGGMDGYAARFCDRGCFDKWIPF